MKQNPIRRSERACCTFFIIFVFLYLISSFGFLLNWLNMLGSASFCLFLLLQRCTEGRLTAPPPHRPPPPQHRTIMQLLGRPACRFQFRHSALFTIISDRPKGPTSARNVPCVQSKKSDTKNSSLVRFSCVNYDQLFGLGAFITD